MKIPRYRDTRLGGGDGRVAGRGRGDVAYGTPGRWRTGYRRRNPLPAALVALALGVTAIVTWSVVLASTANPSQGSCNPPTANPPGPVPGVAQDRSVLDDQQPVPATAVRVHVLNGSGQRDQAKLAASELAELGFGEAGDPANDPLYPDSDLSCFGQIRYGPAGAAAARTLSLVVPCAELVLDGRGGDVVDLSLGKDFTDIDPPRSTRNALDAIARVAATGSPGAQPASADTGIDPAQLDTLRQVNCGG